MSSIQKKIAKQHKKNYILFGVKTLSLLSTFLTRDKLMDSFTWNTAQLAFTDYPRVIRVNKFLLSATFNESFEQ